MLDRLLGAILLAACAGSVVVTAPRAAADDWPHWRGPTRNDLSRESSGYRPGVAWPGPELWSCNVGEGSSSPLVVRGKLYVTGWRDEHDWIVCLGSATGRELWKASVECPRYGRRATGDEGLYAGTCSTAEFDAASGYLYTLSIDGDLVAWDTARRGAKVWSENLYDRFDVARRPKVTRIGGQRDYGYTTAPLLMGDLLIVEVGDDEGLLMAFDRRSGRRRWTSEHKDFAGHTGGPAPIVVEGVPCVAVMALNGLVVVRTDRPDEGRTVATHAWTTAFANNIASASVHGDSVLITSGYNQSKIAKLKITLQGASLEWEQPVYSKVCTPVVHGGHVYFAWQKLHCLDWNTGKQMWEGGRYGDAGSLVATADGRLIAWGGRGTLALVDMADRSPDKYRELARRDGVFADDVWPHVVLSDGRLYLKDRHGNLKCFALP